jgi:hypothetical protein
MCKEGMKLNGRILRASAHGRVLAAQRLRVFNHLEYNTLTQMSLGARAVIYRGGFKNAACSIFIFIVAPCILIILKLYSPTNALFIKHMKC